MPLRSIKLQYFFAFAVMGSLLPFIAVLLAERGLSRAQIGDVLAASHLGLLLSPVLLTLLADTRVETRWLAAALFLLGAIVLGALAPVQQFLGLLVLFALHALCLAPLPALQDGLNFAAQKQRLARGAAHVPYHRIRVWGTLGFILPSLMLLLWLRPDRSTTAVVVVAALLSVAGAINALWLPAIRAQRAASDPDVPPEGGGEGEPVSPLSRLPTLQAARAMLRPNVLVFCIVMVLLQVAATAYYNFYPLYLTEPDYVGIETRWVGIIASVGVGVEIFFMLAFGWLVARLGLKMLLILGAAAMALRLALLAGFANVPVAVGTQAFHGLMVLVLHVAPPVYLDQHADDRYRSSIQGLYAMAVVGVWRMIGSSASGRVAAYSLELLFAGSAGLCLLAVIVLVLAFPRSGQLQSAGRAYPMAK